MPQAGGGDGAWLWNCAPPRVNFCRLDHADDVAARLRDEWTGRALILETCHRVEGYVVGTVDADQRALGDSLPAGGKALTGDSAVRHAITVAIGRDSVVVGEDQVLHQLRTSVDMP